jgi:hypothetical protein
MHALILWLTLGVRHWPGVAVVTFRIPPRLLKALSGRGASRMKPA